MRQELNQRTSGASTTSGGGSWSNEEVAATIAERDSLKVQLAGLKAQIQTEVEARENNQSSHTDSVNNGRDSVNN
jgi:regulatory protein YycI of two-component signal transduction system YycFG